MSDCFDHMADAWDDALFGLTGEDYSWDGSKLVGRKRKVICRYCYSTKVHWKRTPERKWVLCNADGSRHYCQSVNIVRK